MDAETKLDAGRTTLTTATLNSMITDTHLEAIGFWNHSKASERFVVVRKTKTVGNFQWFLPYYYRRTNTRIDSVSELADYIREKSHFLTPSAIETFKKDVKVSIKEIFGNATVTVPIFRILLNQCGKWVWNKDFKNPNSQRRIQDIKEKGFTIATKIDGRNTYHMLLPFPRVLAPTYETIPTRIRKAIFLALHGEDAYSGKQAGLSVLPDHKFPEIRWNANTASDNSSLTEEEMRDKFQLVPEWVNQAKREVCRLCSQTGVRGKFAGIDFFYAGGERWPPKVPCVGKKAEFGCIGCFWYDMAKWRNELNKKLRRLQ